MVKPEFINITPQKPSISDVCKEVDKLGKQMLRTEDVQPLKDFWDKIKIWRPDFEQHEWKFISEHVMSYLNELKDKKQREVAIMKIEDY